MELCKTQLSGLKGLYEKAGFYFNGPGYHPWGEASRVYSRNL